jgi:membrane fusion protein, multidrug efflux system
MTMTSSPYLRGRLVVAGALSVALLAACGKTPEPEASASAPAAIEIGREDLVTVSRAEISVGPLVSGELRAAREATVRAEVSGSVLQVSAEEGQSVRQGTLLARIEDQTLREAVASAQSDVRSAELSLEVAQRELQRTETLVKAGALAERDTDLARSAVSAAQAQVDAGRSRLASAREQVSNATVVSPMTGIVSRRRVSQGDVVSPGTELFAVIDPSSMRLEASVSSIDLHAISVGVPVMFEVRGFPGQQFEGRIERVSPTADPTTRQVPIFVTVPNKGGRLLAGLFAEGRITRESRQTLVLPESAINMTGETPWVARVRENTVERVDVKIGLRDEQTERVEIASGLAEGDQLLVGAARGMTPGTPVRIRN